MKLKVKDYTIRMAFEVQRIFICMKTVVMLKKTCLGKYLKPQEKQKET